MRKFKNVITFNKDLFSQSNAWICYMCGEEVSGKNVKGSMQYPFCKKCFEEKFDNDFSLFWKSYEIHLMENTF